MRVKYANKEKLRAQMAKRGIPTRGKKGSATRYVHPRIGRSVVVDDATGEVFHVGGDGFEYP